MNPLIRATGKRYVGGADHTVENKPEFRAQLTRADPEPFG